MMILDTRTPKQRVYDHYDNQCAKCGERDPLMLCVDHVYNDGAQERRNGIKGIDLYRHIIKTGRWDRYQILCWNCNIAKQREHEREQRRKEGKPVVEKKQFSQRVSLVTHEYIANLAELRSCSLSQAFELIIQEHAELSTALKAESAALEPDLPKPSPWAHLSAEAIAEQSLPSSEPYEPIVAKPRRWFSWTR